MCGRNYDGEQAWMAGCWMILVLSCQLEEAVQMASDHLTGGVVPTRLPTTTQMGKLEQTAN